MSDVLRELRPDWVRQDDNDDDWLGYTRFGKHMSVDGFQTFLAYDCNANIFILLTTPVGARNAYSTGQTLTKDNFNAEDLMSLQASFTIDAAEEKLDKTQD